MSAYARGGWQRNGSDGPGPPWGSGRTPAPPSAPASTVHRPGRAPPPPLGSTRAGGPPRGERSPNCSRLPRSAQVPRAPAHRDRQRKSCQSDIGLRRPEGQAGPHQDGHEALAESAPAVCTAEECGAGRRPQQHAVEQLEDGCLRSHPSHLVGLRYQGFAGQERLDGSQASQRRSIKLPAQRMQSLWLNTRRGGGEGGYLLSQGQARKDTPTLPRPT